MGRNWFSVMRMNLSIESPVTQTTVESWGQKSAWYTGGPFGVDARVVEIGFAARSKVQSTSCHSGAPPCVRQNLESPLKAT